MATANYPTQTVNYQPTGDYRPTSSLAVVSLVTALFGLITFGVGSIVGIVTGHIALRDTRGEHKKGRSAAIAGLLVGYIGIVPAALLCITIVMLVAGAASTGSTSTY
ncbi:hypothetical protein Athai_32530 [Actinocatenispora thailandica]|uniref:DUF4190 domain-containing protein n=1 Tax=Actinocatenispora thailandica TaxID=227318 RepID=A0A7R7DQF5_9ACTN|nr:DUF4190 domain-containing protein [Actinocatenispora thailandica]BCJ35750.1 hypothetical protein Athai_32530 [Actinocatenispora thailandica]